MHDKNGTPLNVGDKIILTGTILEFTSDQPTYCNITVELDERMAPDCETPTTIGISARQTIKGAIVSQRNLKKVQGALRGAAEHIRDLRRAMDDQRRTAYERELVLKETIERLCNRGGVVNTCSPFGSSVNGLGDSHVAGQLELLAASFDQEPETGTGPANGTAMDQNEAQQSKGEGVVHHG